ncbi:FAD-dependent monooxygenase [Microbacterium sp. NPDC096154]|uniref:FAD-dependent monooxygenase n=1 Tax=Microbacterium sp. NPDC096154 TaxID=3155549 RepID=UPI003322A8EE
MQYHHNGYRPGDPMLEPALPGRPAEPLQDGDLVDVLIIGTGPAGMMLAAQLSVFGDVHARIIDRNPEPLTIGRADGVQVRTVETFQAFGLARQMIDEGYHIIQTAFWGPDDAERGRIVRTHRMPDDEENLSEMPHLVVNQARMQQYLQGFMDRQPSRLRPDYGFEFVSLEVDQQATRHPVSVTLRRVQASGWDGTDKPGGDALAELTEVETITVRANYVVGCDGARSGVREAIGGKLEGDRQNHAWGVLDILATTDFPDVRLKSVIQSAEHGSILLIPREGGHLFRLYVDLGTITPENRDHVRAMTAEQVADAARAVLAPYTLDVKDVAWFSIYEVGQRVTDKFDDVPAELVGHRMPRVFIAGDACHTHSAKAGQGMNVSMQDTFNLGWKLAHVLLGRAPEALLDTYSAERQRIAQDLIDFDREWSSRMAAGPMDPEHPERGGIHPDEIAEFYQRSYLYTSGTATQYGPSMITGEGTHQQLATGYPVGMRFKSAPVVRISDGYGLHLGHVHRADGAWRIYAFADATREKHTAFLDWLAASPESPVVRYTPEGADGDSVIDVRGIYQQHFEQLGFEAVPAALKPTKGAFGLTDYEKAFSADVDGAEDIFDARGIDRERGAVVVVRPDMYVADVLPLDATGQLAAFFDHVLTTRS